MNQYLLKIYFISLTQRFFLFSDCVLHLPWMITVCAHKINVFI